MKIEIVTHCWKYWRALTYQVSSLILYPPDYCEVLLSIYCNPSEDANTAKRLQEIAEWKLPPNVRYRECVLETKRLCRRAIGRNLAALSTEADLVWFIDCDMTLGEGALDELSRQVWVRREGVLFHPRHVGVPTQERGDKILMDATSVDGPCDVDPDDFGTMRYNRAIGGVQIVDGDVCRKDGYLPKSRRYQRPANEWARTFEDKAFRHYLNGLHGSGPGLRLALPNVRRIRHTKRGRIHKGLEL